MNRKRWAAIAAIVLVAVGIIWYFASPIWTLGQMKDAAEENDFDRLASYIDFPALREDLKAEIMVEMMEKAEQQKASGDEFAEVGLAFGTAMLGPMVDRMVTPEAMRAAFLDRTQAGSDGGPLDINFPQYNVIDRRGMSTFHVKSDAEPDKVLVFNRNGFGWKLSGVDRSSGVDALEVTDSGGIADEAPQIAEPPPFRMGSEADQSNISSECLRKWAFIPTDKSAGANAVMVWLRDDGVYHFQSGDALNDELRRGEYSAGDDASGPDFTFETGSSTQITISDCTSSEATLTQYYAASQYEEKLKLKPFKGDLIEELELRGFDRTPS